MSQRLEEWDWEYRPVEVSTDINDNVTMHEPDIVNRYYEVWDPACVTWATFNTYALAKEHARHLSNQIGFEHVLNWKHYTEC